MYRFTLTIFFALYSLLASANQSYYSDPLAESFRQLGDIGKLNVNLEESEYKEIKQNISRELGVIRELLKNNYELDKYDTYSTIHFRVYDRIDQLPIPHFELKQQLEEQKLSEKIKTRIDNILTKISYDKDDDD
ncbi:hypothetical protein Megvenef_00587 [Candidatus Megaera venefica]|uniref:Uncharacterized protein n=1 Tax=Candidatus Megaera venefica TaxID=2055910 RepID=A0ABU5NBQ7_9RICK|nr:hypothetical protein [Candidatus Megaera venefica]MEA0970620.1 hypothetical protein [Candidatus Megaera venefica]